MKKKYIIDKDIYLNKYIIWEVHRNYMVDIFKGYKYQCKEFLKNEKNINTAR